jgi:hypothetical protein
MFEEAWQVSVSAGDLIVRHPKGHAQQISLKDIHGIAIQTNDSGPIGSDVIWHVSDGKSVIFFPMGATGESDVLPIFQKFQGFDNLAFINAMSSTDDHLFILFEKTKA